MPENKPKNQQPDSSINEMEDQLEHLEGVEPKSSEVMQEMAKKGRGKLLTGLLVGAQLFFNPVGSSQKAEADKPRNSQNSANDYNRRRSLIENQLAGPAIHPDKLPNPEILLMDESLNAISRQLMQESFIKLAIPHGKSKQVEDNLFKLIRHYDKLHYEKKGNEIIITRRHSKKLRKNKDIPKNFKVVLKEHSKILKEVNGVKISSDVIGDWQTEGKALMKRLSTVNKKISNILSAEHNKTNSLGRQLNARDKKTFTHCHLDLPRRFQRLLTLKQQVFGNHLSAEERALLRGLNIFLRGHPKNYKEFKNSLFGTGRKRMKFAMRNANNLRYAIVPWPNSGQPIPKTKDSPVSYRLHVTGYITDSKGKKVSKSWKKLYKETHR